MKRKAKISRKDSGTLKVLKARVIKDRGLTAPPKKRLRRRTTKTKIPFSQKTLLMLQLERKHQCEIEDLILTGGSVRDVAEQLNINYATVSKWRKLVRKLEPDYAL